MKERIKHFGRFYRLNYGGLVVGFLLYCFSLTPSLLPRPAVFEGLLAGICFAVGYGVGVFFSWAVRLIVRREPSAHVKKIAWRVMLGVMGVAVILYAWWAASWQNEVRRLIGETEFQGQHIVTIVLVAFVTATVLIFLARLIYRSIYVLSGFVERWLPRRISFAIGTVLVAMLLVLVFNGVLMRTFVAVSNNIYRSTNDKTKQGVMQPTSAFRSGGEGSLVTWDSIGRQGRSFVAGGPSQTQLKAFDGTAPVAEPIRVYIGVKAAYTPEERAELAVKELERTGAFSRKVMAVMTATGTGWIEPQTADALEYLWSGDSALVSIQYSYLPSWISFMVDRENSVEASKALFDAVYEKWRTLPPETRPKLLAYGLSLGSFGAQASFSGVGDIQSRTDGALFVGTPNNTDLWQHFTRNRDKGSPEWQPIYDEGKAVRFGAQGEDLNKLKTAWGTPRIVYLQHASDPIVWWSPDLIWHEPDWLMEKRGPDVSPKMQWYPFVTFFQVSVDQFFGTFAPIGHGHNYSDSIVHAWAALAAPQGWTAEKSDKLQDLINDYPTEH